MKTIRTVTNTLSIVLAASTALLAQTQSPDLNQTSYYQESTILVQGSDGLGLYSLGIPIQHQEWSETFAIGMYPIPNSTKVRLNVEKNYGETAAIRLFDEDGRVLDEKWLNKRTNKFGCVFNFSPSQDGTYIIEVANGQEVIRKTIKLATPRRKIVALN